MANKIPDPLSRRHLLEKDLSGAQAVAIAEAYIAAGRSVEAIDFLAKAEAEEQLNALRVEAVEAGDFFLLRAATRALGEAATPEEWEALARAAEAAGKDVYAADARRQLDRGEG